MNHYIIFKTKRIKDDLMELIQLLDKYDKSIDLPKLDLK